MHEVSGRRAGFESGLALTSCVTCRHHLLGTPMLPSGSNKVMATRELPSRKTRAVRGHLSTESATLQPGPSLQHPRPKVLIL